MKTKKTLIKRIKISKKGKIVKKQNNLGHLNRKLTASKKSRKNGREVVETRGYIKKVKTLLGKAGKNIK